MLKCASVLAQNDDAMAAIASALPGRWVAQKGRLGDNPFADPVWRFTISVTSDPRLTCSPVPTTRVHSVDDRSSRSCRRWITLTMSRMSRVLARHTYTDGERCNELHHLDRNGHCPALSASSAPETTLWSQGMSVHGRTGRCPRKHFLRQPPLHSIRRRCARPWLC